ncbi:MAG: methyl-accepting chemotaxis protein [Sporomusaceae bacterium]|nr:methyl-accepting chemotaxis protein [Sporomusaceae bacterium]
MRNIRSIRSTLILLMTLVLIVTAGLLTTVNYTKTEAVIIKDVEQNVLNTTKNAANEIDFWMQLRIAEMEGIASSPILKSGDKNAIISYLAEENKRMPVYSAFWVSDTQGNWYSPAGTSGSISQRAYFKELIATGKTVISDPLIGKADGKMAVVVAIPIKSNGQVVGIMGGNVKMDELLQVVSSIKIGKMGFATLYQFDGTVIADQDTAKIMTYNPLQDKDSSLSSVIKNIQNSETGIQAVRENGKEEYVAYMPLHGVKWGITSTAFLDEFKGPLVSIGLWSIGTALGLVIVAIFIVVLFTRRITDPLQKLKAVAEKLEQGDWTTTINIHEKNEIGDLAHAFQSMADNIKKLIGQIKQSAEQVAAASEELTASAEQSALVVSQVAGSVNSVAQGAEKQLKAIDETSAVVAQMSAGIQQAAANTNQVAAHSTQASEKAKAGNVSIEQAVSQMTHIEQTVKHSAQVVAKLGERSKEIGQIVDTISGIAGQTNLLALNAAIEAARAGEQGRGFAVVAEEVRKLAEQSQEAAKQIAALISEIQGDTDKAVVAMDEGTREVEVGAEVVTTAGKTFEDIADLITKVSGQVKEISTVMQQIASGSEQIVMSVKEIDGLSKTAVGEAQMVSASTEEQAASMEEIASSSQNLAKLAKDLQVAVSQFRV